MSGRQIWDCIKTTLRIQPAVLLYCSVSILTKCAAGQLPRREEGMTLLGYALHMLLELRFVGIVFLMFLGLVLYAFIWQRLIKGAKIAVVYANKSSSILWGQLAAIVLFREHVAKGSLLGLFVIIVGIILVNTSGVKGE